MESLTRLNKYLVEVGYCSRRKADELIEKGLVSVNGIKAVLGQKINDSDSIKIAGIDIVADTKKIIIAYNKPKGVICTESDIEKNEKISDKIKEFGIDKRLFTIGRLDKDSTGLIIITNDGALSKEITTSKNEYEKEYEVRVSKPITNEFLFKMSNGLEIEVPDDKAIKNVKNNFIDNEKPMKLVKTKKCKVHRYGDELYRFSITITEGLNRQIRRMCRTLGYHVVDLKRIRIMKLKLGDLKVGQYKIINKKDIF